MRNSTDANAAPAADRYLFTGPMFLNRYSPLLPGATRSFQPLPSTSATQKNRPTPAVFSAGPKSSVTRSNLPLLNLNSGCQVHLPLSPSLGHSSQPPAPTKSLRPSPLMSP